MNIKKFIASILTAGMMLTFIPSTAMAATKGWNGNDTNGWRYYTTSKSYVKNDWKQIGGKWYYFNSKGYMESNCYRDGCWLTKSGVWDTRYSYGTWKKDSTGWWYTDNGWYPKNQWLWIDGSCYYFNSKGYIETDCYRDGCWLTSSGAWDTRYSHGTWKQNSIGWWYEDNGWYPKDQWLCIDGTKYWFDTNGYWNPSGPVKKPTVKVTDAVNKTYTFNNLTFTQVIPEVTISGKDMSAVNKKIYDDALPSQSNNHYLIDYSAYINDDIISIIISKDLGYRYDCFDMSYSVYNISVKTGKLISSSELIKSQGLTDSQFFDMVKVAYDEYWEDTKKYPISNEMYYTKWYQENYNRIFYEYVSPFISKSGDLCFVSYNMNVYGGSDRATLIFNTANGQQY